MMNGTRLLAMMSLLALLPLSACDSMQQMGGTVTFSDDGTPLTVGSVCFESETHAAYGNLQKDGTYVMGSLKQNDGLPLGTYQVYITGTTQDTGEKDRSGMAITKSLIAKKFTDKRLTDLTVTVDGTSRRFDFQVDRPE